MLSTRSLHLSNNFCDKSFFNVLRPYLAGSKNNSNIKGGFIFEGVSNEPKEYYGGSAAQCSLIQVFDAILGIKHEDGYFKDIRYWWN